MKQILAFFLFFFSFNLWASSPEDLEYWKNIVGHELLFSDPNFGFQSVGTYNTSVLKSKKFNKKNLLDIDFEGKVVLLKDATLLTIPIGDNYVDDRIFLTLSLNGEDFVIHAMSCYDKTEIDNLNKLYLDVFIHECPYGTYYNYFGGKFKGIVYNETTHRFILTTDDDKSIVIEPTVPHYFHEKFCHNHSDHYPSNCLCAIREALEYGTKDTIFIPQKRDNLIRF